MFGFELEYSYKRLPNGLEIFGKPTEDNRYVLKYVASGPEFGLIAPGLEESTFINHITGRPFVLTSILYRQIFMQAIKLIEFPDNPNLTTKKIAEISIDTENYNLVKMICKDWMKKVL